MCLWQLIGKKSGVLNERVKAEKSRLGTKHSRINARKLGEGMAVTVNAIRWSCVEWIMGMIYVAEMGTNVDPTDCLPQQRLPVST